MIRWWLFLAIAGLFAFVFLAFRLRAVKRMSGALNLALEYKQNPLRYMSALLIFGFILISFNLASVIFYFDINRLTLYHCILTDYIEKKIEYISSPQIAELLHIDNTQVRKGRLRHVP